MIRGYLVLMGSVVLSGGAGSENAAVTAPADVVGDWAGWAYVKAGGDLPLRLHVRRDGDGLTATLDLPAQKTFAAALEPVRLAGDRFRFVHSKSQDGKLAFEGTLTNDVIAGEATLDGEPYLEFELCRSPIELPHVDPAEYAGLVGSYRAPGGRVFVITARFWGELVCTDSLTGRRSTLFPLSATEFFVGSALYVPGPITARLRFRTERNGAVSGLEWKPATGAPIRAKRSSFVEEDVSFRNGDLTLHGTLVRPEGRGPFPAVVMIGGSGWRSRRQVRAHADHFVSMGLAALCYDKRGHGATGGEATVPFATTAADALAAVRHLRSRPEIRSDQIGLFGVSRGGWLAPLAASQSKDVAFLVVFVAPAVSPERQETTRRLNAMRADGFSGGQVAEAADYLEIQWDYAATGKGWDEYIAARRKAEKDGWLKHAEGSATNDLREWRWARLNMRYDPLPAIERLRCPVLAVFGERDSNVVPAENVPLWEAALKRSSCSNWAIKVIDKANHGLRLVDANGRSLPIHRNIGYAPGVWRLVHEWVNKQAKPGG